MRRPRLFRHTAAAALAAAIVVTGTLPALAVEQSTDDYPTWEDVQAAKQSESDSQAEYARLQRALQRAQDEASAATEAAADATAVARAASHDLQLAQAKEASLQQQIAASEHEFADNDEALGRMVSWLYTNGTGLASASALADAQNPEDFMAKIGMATQVSGTWNGIAERAESQVNTAASLNEQAADAAAERERLSQAADAAAADAAAAAHTAQQAVALADERTDTMYAQLASLRGTTADVERRYQIGVQVAEQAAEQERAREEAARQEQEQQENDGTGGGSSGGGGDSGGSGSGGSGSGGSGGGAVVVDPAGAQAHARSVLPAYGWGDDQFSCLVSLWTGESDWRADALNPWSGAYGIPQSLPAEKMATAGADWLTNGNTQVDWGLAYIQSVYGTPCNAWNTWQARNPHWY